MTMKSMVVLNRGKDRIGETTTIMIQTILETTMVKSEIEGQGVSMEKARMASTMQLHLETDQEGIITTNKRHLRLKSHTSKY